MLVWSSTTGSDMRQCEGEDDCIVQVHYYNNHRHSDLDLELV